MTYPTDTGMMTMQEHIALQDATKQTLLLERQRTGLMNQVHAMRGDGVPEMVLHDIAQACKSIKREVNRRKRQLAKMCADHPTMQWAETVHGLGDAVALVMGLAPPLADFPTPSKLWKYGGFAPDQGRQKGKDPKYSHDLHSMAIIRLAKPCMNQRLSPYRAVYDRRRAHTLLTHPEWTDGHSHNDALRITAKAILLDMWLVAHGKRPREGQKDVDAHHRPAPHRTTTERSSDGHEVSDTHPGRANQGAA